MADERTFKSLGVIASNATVVDDRDPVRGEGTAYRNTSVNTQVMEQGLVYAALARSDNTNQKLFNISSFTDQIDRQSILSWSNLVDYRVNAQNPAIVARGDKLYFAKAPSGPSIIGVGPIDPASNFDVSNWWQEFESAEPLKEQLADEDAESEGSRLVGYTNEIVKKSLDVLYDNLSPAPLRVLAYGYLDILQFLDGTLGTVVNENSFNLRQPTPEDPFPVESLVSGGGPAGTRIYFENHITTPYIVSVNFSETRAQSIGFRGYVYSFDNLTSTSFDIYPRVRGNDGNTGGWQFIYFGPNRGMHNTFSFIVYKLRNTTNG